MAVNFEKEDSQSTLAEESLDYQLAEESLDSELAEESDIGPLLDDHHETLPNTEGTSVFNKLRERIKRLSDMSYSPSEDSIHRRSQRQAEQPRLGRQQTMPPGCVRGPSEEEIQKKKLSKSLSDTELVRQRKRQLLLQLHELRASLSIEKDAASGRRSLVVVVYNRQAKVLPLVKLSVQLRTLLFWALLLCFLVGPASGLQVGAAIRAPHVPAFLTAGGPRHLSELQATRLASRLVAPQPAGDGSDQSPGEMRGAAHAANPPVVIVPGFMCGQGDYMEMAESLAQRGVRVAIVPIESYHWLPTVTSNSMLPILEAIDHTVKHLSSLPEEPPETGISMSAARVERLIMKVPPMPFSISEMIKNALPFRSSGEAEMEGTAAGAEVAAACEGQKVALVAHSAAGWISRLYLSDKSHYGKAFCGSKLVQSLVTLGTPHQVEAGPTVGHVRRANEDGGALPDGVDCLTVASIGTKGDASAFARMSYHICEGFKDVTGFDGDGVTTVDSALGVPGADRIVLDGVTHMPPSQLGDAVSPDANRDMPWYGSESQIDTWLPWLTKREKFGGFLKAEARLMREFESASPRSPDAAARAEGASAPSDVSSAQRALAHLYAALNKGGESSQMEAFFSADVQYEDLISGASESGPSAVVEALRLHPHLISDQLPSNLPRLSLHVESVAEKSNSAVVEWQAQLGGNDVPLGRGLTMVDLDDEGKITRVVNVAEVPWRTMGRAAVAVGQLSAAASNWFDVTRTAASEMLCETMPGCELGPGAGGVVSVSAGMLVDTASGNPDKRLALLVDTTGDGRADKVLHVDREQARLQKEPAGEGDSQGAPPGAARRSALTMDATASPTMRGRLPETAGGAAIMGFYDSFNMRDLDGLGEYITDDCVYEDLLLGAATVVSGKENLINVLRFHPAFAAEQISLPFLDKIPRITLEVVNMVEGGENVVGIEWQAMIGGKELPMGRGLSQVRICPITGKIVRVTDIAEAAWRVLGMLSQPAVPMLEFLEEHGRRMLAGTGGERSPAQDAPEVSHGQFVDTSGDGLADSMLVDSDGDGRVDAIVPLTACCGTA